MWDFDNFTNVLHDAHLGFIEDKRRQLAISLFWT
jgi:hypothetical protein